MKMNNMLETFRPRFMVISFIIGLAISLAAPEQARAGQQSFASPDAAVTALVTAIQSNNTQDLLEILGPGGEKLVTSGDPVADAASRKRFLDAYAAKHSLTPQPGGAMLLVVGENDWPLPLPVVQVNSKWQFDSVTGAQDIVDRRIGQNELKTIQTLLSLVDAEKDYFDRVKRGTGTGVYAERVISHPGLEDGLYWDTADGEAESPLGPLIAQAEDEGYPGADSPAGKQYPYQGYFFRILKAQGPDAPGGAAAYIKDGEMTGGFAFVAWPAIYENSGIMTFVVNQDGIVFQKDLGNDTAEIAGAMKDFNPDFSWARIDISN